MACRHGPVHAAEGNQQHIVTYNRVMSIVYFTIVAVILYFAADWILERVEVAVGKRLEHRSLIFFAILLMLAVTSFSLIQNYTGGS
jgi:presenilin-like A22 family membrane protease